MSSKPSRQQIILWAILLIAGFVTRLNGLVTTSWIIQLLIIALGFILIAVGYWVRSVQVKKEDWRAQQNGIRIAREIVGLGTLVLFGSAVFGIVTVIIV
jgi:uncharacterized membrane protein